jgi:hypothetical protein
MLKEGRHNTHMREFGDEMCRRIVAAGIPLWRGFCALTPCIRKSQARICVAAR